MHSLFKTTTASAALATALTLSPAVLTAQDATTGGTVLPDDSTGAATGGATGTASGDLAQSQGTGAADGTATGTATGAATGTATGTELAQDPALDPATGDTAVAQDGATDPTTGTATGTATGVTDPQIAQDAASEDAEQTVPGATGGTADTAQQGTAAQGGTTTEGATDLAADEAATGDAGSQTAGTEPAAAPTETEGTQDTQTAAGDIPSEPTEQMAAVLDKHAELGARPLEELSVEEARTQPTPADAVMALMEEQGIETPPEIAAIATRDVTYPGADGSELPARVYTPEGEGPFPLIVYYHGGGWVIADLDTYDASARALSAGAEAVVVSVHYRQAPENPFPAAHEDANAAFTYFVENSGEINADVERLAVAGESAGGNLAFNVAAFARDGQLTPIDHMLLVYPVAGNDMETASYQTNAEARPLSRAGMMWFVENVFEDQAQTSDPRINLVGRDDLAGLPPATVILAEIDPLTTEGVTLASRLEEAGVPVEVRTFDGVTHEFFGMGAVVPEAQEAVDLATTALRAAFDGTAPATADASVEDVTGVEATAAEGAAGGADAATTGDAAPVELEAAEPNPGEDAATGDQ